MRTGNCGVLGGSRHLAALNKEVLSQGPAKQYRESVKHPCKMAVWIAERNQDDQRRSENLLEHS
jgi:hypothetical protein